MKSLVLEVDTDKNIAQKVSLFSCFGNTNSIQISSSTEILKVKEMLSKLLGSENWLFDVYIS